MASLGTDDAGDWLGAANGAHSLARAKHKCVNWYRNKSRRAASETISAVWFHQSASQRRGTKKEGRCSRKRVTDSHTYPPGSRNESVSALGAHTLGRQLWPSCMLFLSFECARRHTDREKTQHSIVVTKTLLPGVRMIWRNTSNVAALCTFDHVLHDVGIQLWHTLQRCPRCSAMNCKALSKVTFARKNECSVSSVAYIYRMCGEL